MADEKLEQMAERHAQEAENREYEAKVDRDIWQKRALTAERNCAACRAAGRRLNAIRDAAERLVSRYPALLAADVTELRAALTASRNAITPATPTP